MARKIYLDNSSLEKKLSQRPRWATFLGTAYNVAALAFGAALIQSEIKGDPNELYLGLALVNLGGALTCYYYVNLKDFLEGQYKK